MAYTPGVLTDAVADATILLLLGASRQAYEAQRFLRAGERPDGAPLALMGRQLTGKVLGIFGMGRIGQAVAHRARALGMQIHYTNPSPLSGTPRTAPSSIKILSTCCGSASS